MWWNAMWSRVMQIIYAISMLFDKNRQKQQSLDIWLRFCRDVRGTRRKPSKQRSSRLQTKGQPRTHEKPLLHQMTERMSVWGWEVDGDTVSKLFHTHAHTQNQPQKTDTSAAFFFQITPLGCDRRRACKGTWLVKAIRVFAWKKDTASLKD